MTNNFAGQLTDSIILEDGDSVVIQDEIIAPVGQPAVDIIGDDAELEVTANGSILANDIGNTAVQVTGNNDEINNFGLISGDFNGVNSTGEDLTLVNRGIIQSNSRAVNLGHDGSNLQNFDTILGTGVQRNGTIYVDGPADNVTINNRSDGVIDAGEGNSGDGISLQVGATSEDALSENIDIRNSGLIAGRGQADFDAGAGGRLTPNGSSGVRFFNGSGEQEAILTGILNNSGTISAEVNVGFLGGVVVEDGVAFQGRIINRISGIITGPRNGLYIGNADHDLSIKNNGLIESGSRVVNLDGNNVSLNNTGDIIGTGDQRNGTIYVDGPADNVTINNRSNGVIDAGEGNSGDGISLQVGATSEDGLSENIDIRNSGLIAGRGQADFDAGAGGRLTPNGSSGVRFFNGSGEQEAILTGILNNSGTISAEVNVGFLGGVIVEDGVAFQGRIINRISGIITGPRNGLYIGNADHDLSIKNNGLIESGSRVVNLDGDNLSLNNRGRILGTGDQRNGTIYVDGTADDVTINNRSNGVIDAGEGNSGDGISLQVGAASEDGLSENIDIRNSGLIAGRGQADFDAGAGGRLTPNGSSGVRFFNGSGEQEAILTGILNNSGTISAEVNVGFLGGVVVEDGVAFQGTIDNRRRGVIRGPRNGLYVGNAEHDLTINNDGRIESDSRAVNLDGDNIILHNRGRILGTGDQRNGTIYVDGTGDNITIDNRSIRSVIDAGEGNSGDGISVQVGAVSEDALSENINIRNSGLIAGRGQADFDAGAGGRLTPNGSSGVRFFNGSGEQEAILTSSITNFGTISAEVNVGFLGGVVVEDGVAFQGIIDNRRRGVITGPRNGLYIGNAEHDLTINNDGRIESDSRAVNLDGDNIILDNRGRILGTGDQRNGTIYVDGTGDNITIDNRSIRSVIDAGEGNSGDGISVQVGAVSEDALSENINIINSGLIAGRGQADFDGGAGGRLTPNGSSGVRFFNGSGEQEAILTSSITNFGTISAEVNVGFLGGVVVEDGVAFQGTIDNRRSGVITGPRNGLYIGNAEHDLTINNDGRIDSGSRAVNLDGDNIILDNRGRILGTGDQRNGTIYVDGTGDNITIDNRSIRSVIDAGEGNSGDGISVQVGAVSEDALSENINIINSGLIAGRGQADFDGGAGGRLTPNGSSGVRFFNGSGEQEAILTSSITNFGTISAEVNVGFLGGVVVEDGVAFQGTIDNRRSGVITGPRNGLYIGNAEHDLTINNDGRIESDSRAVNLDGDNIILDNRGRILGTGDQRNGTIYVDGTGDNITIDNRSIRSVIDAGEGNSGDGISVQVGAVSEDALSENINIINSGLIAGRGQADFDGGAGGRLTPNGSSGVRFFNGSGEQEAILTSSITNFGTISAEVNVGFLGGVVVEDGVAFQGTIDNRRSGVITGPRNGLYIGNAEHDLTINNDGRIESDSRAVNLDGDNIILDNRGRILGTGDQRNGTIYVDGTGDNITINNQSRGLIDAGAGNSGSGVSIQVGAANGLGGGIDDLEISANIFNDGLIQGRGDQNVPAGVRLFVGSGLTEATFIGDIINEENGVIASEQEAGILIEEGVIFDGDIVNDGLIEGGNGLAIAAGDALGNIDIINNGQLIGAVQLGTGDDSFTQNSSDSVTVNGGAGDDLLTGGISGDTFGFTLGSGDDTITNFQSAHDILDIRDFFNDFNDVLLVTSQVGNDVLIQLDMNNSVTLENLLVGDLTAGNFLLI